VRVHSLLALTLPTPSRTFSLMNLLHSTDFRYVVDS
jgi:hypothetical protein